MTPNVLRHGTGGLNIDGCRVGTDEALGRFNNARTGGTSYVVQREAEYVEIARARIAAVMPKPE